MNRPAAQLHRLAIALALVAGLGSGLAQAQDAPRFSNVVEGNPLDFSGLRETETDAVRKFKANGRNPYNADKVAIEHGESLFSTACSGCHGHNAEGKLGPGLADDYWTYNANKNDVGLFSSIFGGLQGQMGPQRGRLTQDEILQVMAWVRSIYTGDPKKADWLK
ncbi:cytochrome c(L), periplasmic [Derxia lacustris]|uniref:cytochrome c(L), periplasmic n=1 Tax=Derxia lacustris TaxID=764842 RepID=UPI000A16EFFD|nr:cytochrome c(L), periplasmic [Derxia lacustris]